MKQCFREWLNSVLKDIVQLDILVDILIWFSSRKSLCAAAKRKRRFRSQLMAGSKDASFGDEEETNWTFNSCLKDFISVWSERPSITFEKTWVRKQLLYFKASQRQYFGCRYLWDKSRYRSLARVADCDLCFDRLDLGLIFFDRLDSSWTCFDYVQSMKNISTKFDRGKTFRPSSTEENASTKFDRWVFSTEKNFDREQEKHSDLTLFDRGKVFWRKEKLCIFVWMWVCS